MSDVDRSRISEVDTSDDILASFANASPKIY